MAEAVDLDQIGRRIATDLLDCEAVAWSPDKPFTWASGLRAPLYCDNRRTLSYPETRRLITDGFEALVARHALAPDVIAGTATAGIPQAAWLADRLALPMAYVRSKPKEHGQKNSVEGVVERGQRVVLVEDLVSTGGSSINAAQAVQEEAGADVVAVLAIFSYGLDRARAAFSDVGLPLYTLTDLAVLLEVARKQDRLSDEALATLQSWRQDPKAWPDAWKARSESR